MSTYGNLIYPFLVNRMGDPKPIREIRKRIIGRKWSLCTLPHFQSRGRFSCAAQLADSLGYATAWEWLQQLV